MRGFSFSSVVLSYFLVGGGMFSALLVLTQLEMSGEVPGYLMVGVGGFVGGFVAARASKGSTILEPAIGAIAVVGTIVGLVAASEVGRMIWNVAQDETMKFVGLVGLSSAGGAIAGAYISEKIHGESSLSSLPWILYVAFATFGACVLATIIGTFLFAKDNMGPEMQGDADTLAKMVLVGLVIGCLLSGIASGAQARMRILGAAAFGGGLGVTGLGLLAAASGGNNKDAAAGIAVLAIGGAIVTLLGAAIGWAVVGKKNAG